MNMRQRRCNGKTKTKTKGGDGKKRTAEVQPEPQQPPMACFEKGSEKMAQESDELK